MFDHQISRFEKRIADLPDQPTLAPDALKAWFDSAPEQLRQALNRVCADGAFSQANLIYGGLATAASPAKTVEIAENGFNVLSSSSLYNGNNPMYTFKYIALR